jgi:low affinity Fe/Cu permease
MLRPARATSIAVFAAIFAASCTFNLDAPAAVDADKAMMYMQLKSADAVFAAQLAVVGDPDAFDALVETRMEIITALQRMRERGSEREAAELDAAMREGVAAMEQVIKARENVLMVTELSNSVLRRTPQMSAQLAEVVRGMSDAGASASQINLANRQVVLLDRMGRRVTEILAGGDMAVTATDALQRDRQVFSDVLAGMEAGSDEQGIVRVELPGARNALDQVIALNHDQGRELDAILAAANDLAEVQQAAATLSEHRDRLLAEAPPTY